MCKIYFEFTILYKVILLLFFHLDLAPPSKTYHYEDKTGFLRENIVIESPVLTGKITWFDSIISHRNEVCG